MLLSRQSACLELIQPFVPFPAPYKLGVVAHSCHTVQEAEAGGSEVQDHPQWQVWGESGLLVSKAPTSRKILHMALIPIFTKIDIDLPLTIKGVSAIVTPNIFPKLHSHAWLITRSSICSSSYSPLTSTFLLSSFSSQSTPGTTCESQEHSGEIPFSAPPVSSLASTPRLALIEL